MGMSSPWTSTHDKRASSDYYSDYKKPTSSSFSSKTICSRQTQSITRKLKYDFIIEIPVATQVNRAMVDHSGILHQDF